MRLTLFATAALCVSSLVAHADSYTVWELHGSHGEYMNLGFIDNGNDFVIYNPDLSPDPFQIFDLNTGTSTYSSDPSLMDAYAPGTSGTGNIYYPGTNYVIWSGEYSRLMYSGNDLAFVGSDPFKTGGFEVNFVEVDWTTRKAAAVTPEPSSFALLGTGLLGLYGVARKRFA